MSAMRDGQTNNKGIRSYSASDQCLQTSYMIYLVACFYPAGERLSPDFGILQFPVKARAQGQSFEGRSWEDLFDLAMEKLSLFR